MHMGKTELLHVGKLSNIYFQLFKMDSTAFEIKSYRVSIFGRGRNPDLDLESHSDSIPPVILEHIKAYDAGSQVFFEFIRALNRKAGGIKESVLPPLTVLLTDD